MTVLLCLWGRYKDLQWEDEQAIGAKLFHVF